MLIGQENLKKMMQTAIDRGRLAHAYLFYGQPGTGKDAFSIRLAMGLLCKEHAPYGCGKCPSCVQIISLNHSDFHFILPVPRKPEKMKDEKYFSLLRERALARIENPYLPVTYVPDLTTAPVISIDQIRSIKKIVMIKPSMDTKRIFIISKADALTDEASNSLLKLLEEPPQRTYFFLSVENPSTLNETIVSRCQLFHLKGLSSGQIKNALIENWEFDVERAEFLSRMSGGSLQNAVLLTKDSIEGLREDAITFLAASMNRNLSDSLELLEKFNLEKDREIIIDMLNFLKLTLRDFFMIQNGYFDAVIQTDKVKHIKPLVYVCADYNIEKALDAATRAIDSIRKNAYLPLVIFSLAEALRSCAEQKNNN